MDCTITNRPTTVNRVSCSVESSPSACLAACIWTRSGHSARCRTTRTQIIQHDSQKSPPCLASRTGGSDAFARRAPRRRARRRTWAKSSAYTSPAMSTSASRRTPSGPGSAAGRARGDTRRARRRARSSSWAAAHARPAGRHERRDGRRQGFGCAAGGQREGNEFEAVGHAEQGYSVARAGRARGAFILGGNRAAPQRERPHCRMSRFSPHRGGNPAAAARALSSRPS